MDNGQDEHAPDAKHLERARPIDTMVKLARVVKIPLWRMFRSHEGENTQPMADGRSAPRSRKWHEDNLKQKVFDFSDAEMRNLRKSAAAAGLSVTDFLRQVLSEAGVWGS